MKKGYFNNNSYLELRVKDSNPRPPGYEPGVLTSALTHNVCRSFPAVWIITFRKKRYEGVF